MAANSSLNLTSLDFDTLKQNLKAFLSSQTIFRDYDFDGSNMSVLLDVMAYNTYIGAFYLNMIGSEAFLDTAQLRDSVVSHAKALNYMPRSARSAVATVDLSMTTSGLSGVLVVPAGTIFSGGNSNGTFSFVTDKTLTILSAGSSYTTHGVSVYEGKLFTESFVVDNTIENQRFVLSNKGIDTTSISVAVVEHSGQVITDYTQAINLFGLTANSKVFFVQEDRKSLYEIVFGDGVFGSVPNNGAVIKVGYRVTKGAKANGVKVVSLAQNLGPINRGTVSAVTNTVVGSSNGADLEDTETVRFQAPKYYQVQGRAVTSSDYKSMIIENFPEVKDVNAFGAEDVSGLIQYGSVAISMTTFSGAPLADARKTDILSFLRDKKSITTRTEIIDPEYINLVPSIRVSVNFTDNTLSAADVSTLVSQVVIGYNSDNLQVFNASFIRSKFSAAIDDADDNVVGSQVAISMYKDVLFNRGHNQIVTVAFRNPIAAGTISSTSFTLSDGKIYQLTDFNPNNNTFKGSTANGSFNVVNSSTALYIRQITTDNSQNYLSAGVVDYANGTIYVQNIGILDTLDEEAVRITATPVNPDVFGTLHDVLQIDLSSALINVASV